MDFKILDLEQQFCFETPLSKPRVSQAGGFRFRPTVSLLFTQLADFSIIYPPLSVALSADTWSIIKSGLPETELLNELSSRHARVSFKPYSNTNLLQIQKA